ncbi:MAG: secretin N-terminal domain-containing protein [Verrucomicrobiales bacterium]
MERRSQRNDGLSRMTLCLCMILALPGAAQAAKVQEALPLTYVDVKEILPTIEGLVGAADDGDDAEKAKFHAIARTNSIVVSGSKKQRALARSLVAKFDQRPEQVYLSAVIAQVGIDEKTPDVQHALSLVTEVELGGKNIALKDFRRPGFSGMVLDARSAGDGVEQSDTFLNSYLTALDGLDSFSVLSRPFVITRNNATATVSSGERIAAKVDGATITYDEKLMSLGVTPVLNPGSEVTLEVDLKLDLVPSSETMAQRLKTTLRVALGDLAIRSTGTAASEDGKRYEHRLFLHPSLVGTRSQPGLPEAKQPSAPKAKPTTPRPALAQLPDNFLRRELQYLRVAEAAPIVARAIALRTETKFEPAPASAAPEPILVGETLVVSDPALNSLTVGPSKHLETVVKLLDETDQRPRQVLIETSLVEVTLGETLKFGRDAIKEGTFGQAEPVEASFKLPVGGAVFIDLKDPSGKAAGRTLNRYVSALAGTSENLKVITAPRLIATNNSESIIIPNKELELRLNPLINSDDEVTLNIKSKREVEISDDNKSHQEFHTMVRLEDGDTIVVGGIVHEVDGTSKELLLLVRTKIIPEIPATVREESPKD